MKKAAGASDVAECILRYLLDNPDAEDTIDGIVEWWVMRQRIRQETARVKEALAELVNEGFVLARQAPGTQVRYRINKGQLRAIRAYLKKASRN
jgi:hypothetical protein